MSRAFRGRMGTNGSRSRRTVLFVSAASPLLVAVAMPAARAGDVFDIEGGEVNISGATLFRDFFASPASTNDWLDVDEDGVGYPQVDQLAPDYAPGQGTWQGWWVVQYRSVGSLNGLDEFVDYQLCLELPESVPSEVGFLNRYKWAETGVILTPEAFRCGDTGTPLCPSSIDLASVDVPTKWAVISGSDANARWDAKPTSDGYGLNDHTSSWLCGVEGQPNELVDLERNCAPLLGGRRLNTNTDNPDENTVFDTTVAWSPVAFVANRGTGLENVKATELQHLYVTGRMPGGENLAVATRDAGSGTRNAAMNPLGIDPSWGVGDHAGLFTESTPPTNLGACHQVSNCGGSSIIENAVQQRRLAVGYSGLAGPSRAANDAFVGRYEVLNVMNDHVGGTQYVRPTIDTVLDNADANTGYRIGGSQTLVSRGDPFETDPLQITYMNNQAAADYIRNIVASIEQFDPNLPGNEADQSPAQFLATRFFLDQGVDRVPTQTDPENFVPTPGFNQQLQNFIRGHIFLIDPVNRDTPAYGFASAAGLVPTRNAGSYTDGGTKDYLYNVNGAPQPPIAGGKKLAERNRAQGDFNHDGLRDVRDVVGMMEALTDPLNYEQGVNWPGDPGDQTANVVIAHVIGDFNGDGNFDAMDARYFADGLALDSADHKLDRKAGFTQVDQAWAALTGDDNYFDTVLASGKAYEPGDSRGDVAGVVDELGNPVFSKGATPIGSDGVVDGRDIDYVRANFGDWSDLDQAAAMDLSADMNGDLVVNQADVDEVVEEILCTLPGDADLDGEVTNADVAIVQGNLGQAGGWEEGDFDGDGVVDNDDLTTAQGNLGEQGECFGGISLTVGGACPGTATVAWAGATPGVQLGLVFARGTGSFVIPPGQPCAGTQLGLNSNQLQLVNQFGSGANGSGQVQGQAGAGACGGFLQLIEAGSCATSNVDRLP